VASPAEVVRACLIAQGLVILPEEEGSLVPYEQTPGDDSTLCFVPTMPDEIDQAVCISNNTSLNFGRSQRDGRQWMHYGVKLIIRTLDNKGHDLAVALATGLDQVARGSVTIGEETHLVHTINRIGSIIDLGEERGKKRQLWSINARVVMQDTEPAMG
jgi:hypothetical protein